MRGTSRQSPNHDIGDIGDIGDISILMVGRPPQSCPQVAVATFRCDVMSIEHVCLAFPGSLIRSDARWPMVIMI